MRSLQAPKDLICFLLYVYVSTAQFSGLTGLPCVTFMSSERGK